MNILVCPFFFTRRTIRETQTSKRLRTKAGSFVTLTTLAVTFVIKILIFLTQVRVFLIIITVDK